MINLDPRTKLVIMAIISFLAMLTDKIWLLIILFLIASWLASLTIGSVKKVCQGIIKSLPLLVSFALGMIFFSPLILILAVIIRFLIIVASAHIFMNTKEQDLLQALLLWKVPYELAFMIMIALHFYPLFLEEAQNIWAAVQMRGLDIRKLKWRKKIAIYTSLIVPLFVGTMNKAYQLAISMEARGFRAYPQRTFRSRLEMKRLDYSLLILFISGGLLTVFFI